MASHTSNSIKPCCIVDILKEIGFPVKPDHNRLEEELKSSSARGILNCKESAMRKDREKFFP